MNGQIISMLAGRRYLVGLEATGPGLGVLANGDSGMWTADFRRAPVDLPLAPPAPPSLCLSP